MTSRRRSSSDKRVTIVRTVSRHRVNKRPQPPPRDQAAPDPRGDPRQILDAAQAFLRERSFRELNVDALMSRTGHTRTVFYRHFDDIPALMLALIQEIGVELLGRREGVGAGRGA